MVRKTLLFSVTFACLAATAWGEDRAVSRRPDGTGDPDATTCRPAQPLPSSRMLGPQVCKTNSQWALLRKNGQDISADGSQIIPDPLGTNVAPLNCSSSGGGASNGGGMTVCH
jgi:hypothetical protein